MAMAVLTTFFCKIVSYSCFQREPGSGESTPYLRPSRRCHTMCRPPLYCPFSWEGEGQKASAAAPPAAAQPNLQIDDLEDLDDEVRQALLLSLQESTGIKK